MVGWRDRYLRTRGSLTQWILGCALVAACLSPVAAHAASAGIPDAWSALSVAALIGGTGVLLIGMEQMSESLKRLASGKLSHAIERLAQHRLVALVSGAAITAAIQSSTAMTVILLSFVEAGLLSFAQTIPMILGANVGTTVSAQILAFKVTDYALLLIGIGFIGRSLIRRTTLQSVFQAALGLGLAFFGLGIMSAAMYPLRESPVIRDIIGSIENVPVGILVGTVFTALVHSSAATLGILLSFASQGLITLEGAIPVIFGANIGTCFTAIIASVTESRNAKRVAAVHTLLNIGGSVMFMFWVPGFAELVRRVSPEAPAGLEGAAALAASVPRLIANAHTFFNVAVAVVFFPAIPLIDKIARRIIPDAEGALPEYHLDKRLLASFANSPDLALRQSLQAIGVVVDRTRAIFDAGTEVIDDGRRSDPEHMMQLRADLTSLRHEVTDYVNALSETSLSPDQSVVATRQALAVSELEHVAQVVVTLAIEIRDEDVGFSDAGREELKRYRNATRELFDLATAAFLASSEEQSKAAGDFKKRLKSEEDHLRRSHISRMRSHVKESVTSDSAHMDLLDALRQVNTYSGRIARLMLDDDEADSIASPAAD